MGTKFKGGYSRMTCCTIGNHPEYDRGFRSGHQSKQEEVNKLQVQIAELKEKIDLALTQISNHYHSCVARKNLKQMSASISEISEIEIHELNMQSLERILKGE